HRRIVVDARVRDALGLRALRWNAHSRAIDGNQLVAQADVDDRQPAEWIARGNESALGERRRRTSGSGNWRAALTGATNFGPADDANRRRHGRRCGVELSYIDRRGAAREGRQHQSVESGLGGDDLSCVVEAAID